MTINRKSMARVAGFTAAATVASGLLFTGAAGADTVVPLPGGHITKTLSDGTVVDISLVGESANINPSLGSTPAHRNAWVSGSAQVSVSGDGGGKIFPGYTVGCQVNIAGGDALGDAGAEAVEGVGFGEVHPLDNDGVVLAATAGAVNVRLGENDPAASGLVPELAHLRAVVGLVWRTVVMWMVFLALLSLARLIG